jgi:hypothetical protein
MASEADDLQVFNVGYLPIVPLMRGGQDSWKR